jgi:hypothetical protein
MIDLPIGGLGRLHFCHHLVQALLHLQILIDTARFQKVSDLCNQLVHRWIAW